MKQMILIALPVLLLCAGAGVTHAENDSAAAQGEQTVERLYRHLVLFKFKDQASAEEIAEVVQAFGELKNQIKTIVDYEHGTDVSPEKLAKGYTHCFLVTFQTKEDLEAYLPHPAHQAFTKKLKPILADVLVVDYWTK